MDIHLYNTLSRKKEIFKAINHGKVKMYNCGPTVYDFAHIGNLRAYVFADFLRGTFEYNGYKVHQIINITDVGHLVSEADEGEDKMTKALKREGKTLSLQAMRDIGTIYFEAFKSDLSELNISMPDKFPRATDHIDEDIEIIKQLEIKGIAYQIADGIYFDTAKFPGYGKLGNISLEDQREGARIANAKKRNPADFVLWKFDSNLGWESPWGKGFPGWHIECSAMARKYLGQPFDIHTGGIDHIPVHHNNEIAQSEAAYNAPLANYWLHSAFLTLNDGKMAKSAGHFVTLKALKENSISPLAYKYWLLTAHYRSPINFTIDAVKAAQNALIKLMASIAEYPENGSPSAEYIERFNRTINDDLDMPQAIALAWEVVKDANLSDADKRATLLDFDNVFGLKLEEVPRAADVEVPAEVQALVDAREEARADKDWKKADALRDEIESRGYAVNDTPEGIRIKAKH